MKDILLEISSTAVKKIYKLAAHYIFADNETKGNEIFTDSDGNPILTASGQKQTKNQYIERAIANKFFRQGENRKFEPGVARLAFENLKWNPLDQNSIPDYVKTTTIKQCLRYISKQCPDKYDSDLNGLSLDALHKPLVQAITSKENEERRARRSAGYEKPKHAYKIVRIDSFRESQKYFNYTNPDSRWCLTYDVTNYRNYTSSGNFAMYFCIRDDIDTVERKIGEDCPMDDYGLSLLCVIVDTKGNLSTFTTRWNHVAFKKPVAADTGLVTEYEVSMIIGQEFEDVFKPYTEEELEEIKKSRKLEVIDYNDWVDEFDAIIDKTVEWLSDDDDFHGDPDDLSDQDIYDYMAEYAGDLTYEFDNANLYQFGSLKDEGVYTKVEFVNSLYRIYMPKSRRDPNLDYNIFYEDIIRIVKIYSNTATLTVTKTLEEDYYKILLIQSRLGSSKYVLSDELANMKFKSIAKCKSYTMADNKTLYAIDIDNNAVKITFNIGKDHVITGDVEKLKIPEEVDNFNVERYTIADEKYIIGHFGITTKTINDVVKYNAFMFDNPELIFPEYVDGLRINGEQLGHELAPSRTGHGDVLYGRNRDGSFNAYLLDKRKLIFDKFQSGEIIFLNNTGYLVQFPKVEELTKAQATIYNIETGRRSKHITTLINSFFNRENFNVIYESDYSKPEFILTLVNLHPCTYVIYDMEGNKILENTINDECKGVGSLHVRNNNGKITVEVVNKYVLDINDLRAKTNKIKTESYIYNLANYLLD